MMKRRTGVLLRLVFAVLTGLAAHTAFAQAVIVDHAPLGAIPTMNGAMLALMALLLAVIAYRVLKAKQGAAGKVLVALLAVGTLGLGASGMKMISESYAVPGGAGLSDPNGGTVIVQEFGPVVNNTGVTQRIVRLTCNLFILSEQQILTALNGGGPVCSDSPPTVLAPGASCTVDPDDFCSLQFNQGGGN